MSTTGAPDRAKAIRAEDVPESEIAVLKSELKGRKLRAGYKHVIETGDPTVAEYRLIAVSIIEVWWKERRCYMPLAFAAGWHFTTPEARDAVLMRLAAK